MGDAAKLHKTIETEIKPPMAQSLKEFKVLSTALEQLDGKVPAAIKSGDARSVRLYLKALTVEVGRVESLLTQIQGLLDKLDALEADDAVADDLSEEETVSKALDKLKTDLIAGLAAGKKLEASAKQFLDKQQGSDNETLERWADLEVWTKKQTETVTKYHNEMPKVMLAATEALAERDEPALEKAIGDGIFYRNQGAAVTNEVIDRLRQFEPSIGTLTDKGLQDKLKRDLDKLIGDIDWQQLKAIQIYVKFKDFKINAVDVKKAAAALKITLTPGIEAKLKKALEMKLSLMEKALDALAKELHLKTTGKNMIAALKQAHLL